MDKKHSKLVAPFVIILFVAPLVLFTNCSSDKTSPDDIQSNISRQIFSDSVTNFNVEVVYESGATPYTGSINLGLDDTWDITEESLSALFQNHSTRTITNPINTSEMTAIADQAKSSWAQAELIALGQTHAVALAQGTTINITVIFVNGTYGGNTNILGVHMTGYPFVFIFKDVVTSVGGSATQQRYVEQATLVHEVGHAIGLVNNGIPMVINHEDGAHPHHSTNNQCVMYWAVESSSSILGSLSSVIGSSQLNLFETESLTDGRSYHP